ncbi:MAG: preprotein translocase subunit SecE [Deltaproteobacteria bacterium]|nr:preprotein translocase subunit SecE [Deltaproteobacteria bacterium]
MAKSTAEVATKGQGFNTFLSESVVELKKVHFPTRKETIQSTLGVLWLIVIFAFILGLTDWVIGRVIQMVMSYNS